MIEFATDMLGLNLFPWQRWLLIHMLELLPDDSMRFRTVVVLVARQNGKSKLSQVLALWFMYCYGLTLILGTAQDLDTAEEVWQAAVDLVLEEDEDDQPVRPELFDLVSDVVKVNGKKALVIGGKGKGMPKRRWKVKAANRRAGRGLSGEFILLDELREHQTWDAWGAITKTTIAKSVALVLALSNAGDSTSVVLRHLRKLAHAKVGDPDGINKADEDNESAEDAPTDAELEEFDDAAAAMLDELEDEDDDSLALFEWSARPDRQIRDRDGWAEANPSLGHSIREKTLASACATDDEWVFRTECLCQWPGGSLTGPFPPTSWEAGRWEPTEDEPVPPKIVGKVMACVSMSHDRKMTAIVFAGYRADGLPQFEVVALRAGDKWVKDYLTTPRRKERIIAVTGLKSGPEGELLKTLKDDLPVVEWAGDNVGGWTGLFYDLVKVGKVDDQGKPVGVRHLPQPALDVAAANAVMKPSGLRFVWNPAKSAVDICTLVGATGAIGLLLTHKPKKPPAKPIRSSQRNLERPASTSTSANAADAAMSSAGTTTARSRRRRSTSAAHAAF